MTQLHPDDRATWNRIRQLAERAAATHGFELWTIEPKRRPHPGGAEGICYQAERRIAIALRWRVAGVWATQPLHLSRVLRTTLHEVAHLPRCDGSPGLGHGPAFRAWERRLVAWAEAAGFLGE